jgi:IS66 Orf2 like protein
MDMRRVFDWLADRVRGIIGQDPFGGHMFLFRSRRGQAEGSSVGS